MNEKQKFDIESINKQFDVVSTSETITEYLTKEQEKKLLIKAKKGCQASKESLIKNLMPFIYTMAHRFSDRMIVNRIDADARIEDLAQCGVIGALKAIDAFELSQECRLCTVSEGFIKEEFKQGYRGKKLDMPYVERMEESIKKMSENLEISECDSHRYLKIFDNGLREDISNPKILSFISRFMEDDMQYTNYDLSRKKILTDLLRLIRNLPFREKMIINSHFGIGSEKLSIKKISEYCELSVNRVREIRSTALLKLRADLIQEAKNLLYYLSQH